MKKQLFIFAAALALVGCSNSSYDGNQDPFQKVTDSDSAIVFSFNKSNHTMGAPMRRAMGAEAAALLGKQFVVMGTKGGAIGAPSSVVTDVVFDHYYVNWNANTAGTTASNTADWDYVGQTDNGTTGSIHTYADAKGITAQTIKYWDYSKGQYDFIAYSGGDATLNYTGAAAGELYVTEITPATATSATNGAYKVTGATADFGKFYIADLVTVPQSEYGNEVQIVFRNLATKVRVGLYETVPGYSIRDVEFYASDDDVQYVATSNTLTAGDNISSYFKEDGTAYGASDVYVDDATTPCFEPAAASYSTTPTLYSQSDNIYSDGTYTVYYPTVNTNSGTAGHPASDLNKAHVSFAPSASGAASTSTFAALDYNNNKTLEGSAASYLGETSNSATYVSNSSTKPYTTVLPNESATALTLRVNYTLVSDDGSKETIKVWGAKAVVPAQYVQWKSNYAYTYLFKISDNTNGQTQGLGLGTAGLTPITFDAIVTETQDGLQETVTTVATPSITTYMKGAPNVTANDEYPAGTIYVMVQDGANILSLTGKGQLYEVTGATTTVPATEANVMDALNMNNGAAPLVGRNGLTLTTATSDATITAIPGVNGNDIVVTAGQAASFSAATGKTYAYVYTVSTGTPSYYNTAVKPANGTDVSSGYYTDFDCTISATGTADGTTTYYQKLTNNNNTYAVKVIKVI